MDSYQSLQGSLQKIYGLKIFLGHGKERINPCCGAEVWGREIINEAGAVINRVNIPELERDPAGVEPK